LRLVFAENEDVYSTPTTFYLTDEGFDVVLVKDKGGLLVEAPSADVLVIDVSLTGSDKMEGIEAMAELVKSGGIRRTVPIVFYSNYEETTPMIRKRLQSLPALDARYRWVHKDLEYEAITDAIEAELARLR